MAGAAVNIVNKVLRWFILTVVRLYEGQVVVGLLLVLLHSVVRILTFTISDCPCPASVTSTHRLRSSTRHQLLLLIFTNIFQEKIFRRKMSLTTGVLRLTASYVT